MDFTAMMESAPVQVQDGQRVRSGVFTAVIGGQLRTFGWKTADNVVPPTGQRIAELESELARAQAAVRALERRIVQMERAQKKDGKT